MSKIGFSIGSSSFAHQTGYYQGMLTWEILQKERLIYQLELAHRMTFPLRCIMSRSCYSLIVQPVVVYFSIFDFQLEDWTRKF